MCMRKKLYLQSKDEYERTTMTEKQVDAGSEGVEKTLTSKYLIFCNLMGRAN